MCFLKYIFKTKVQYFKFKNNKQKVNTMKNENLKVENKSNNTNITNADLFVILTTNKVFKNKGDIGTEMFKYFKTKNIKINSKGANITEDNLKRQVSAIFGCITKKQGPKRWRDFKVEKTEEGLKVIKVA